jgi:hypothetical protein
MNESPCTIKGTEESVLRPVKMTVVSTDFCHHFFVTLDTPMSTNIISVHPALSFGIVGSLEAQESSDSSN